MLPVSLPHDRNAESTMSASAESILDSLDHAIVIVGPDWRIRFANHAWQRVVGVPDDCVGGSIWACCPLLAAHEPANFVRATCDDGATRHFDVGGEDGLTPRLGVLVARTGDGDLLVELSEPFAEDQASSAPGTTDGGRLDKQNEENASLRSLAKQMAGVADSEQLLDILCRDASAQCNAGGAGVITTTHFEGELVAAAGTLGTARGRRFSLAKSLAEEAIATRSTVSLSDFAHSSRPLAQLISGLNVGPILVTPLLAHDAVLGVLVVVRDQGGVAFGAREAQRLRVIADHAALALWKAELLEQAQAADRAKGRFLATISHELRTPLTALAGYEELLADEVIGPLSAPQLDVLERMRSVTQHLTEMIEEVLAFSSLEDGRETVRATDFLAADIVRAGGAIAEPLARHKKLRVEFDLPDEPILMLSDIDKIRQILVNLVGNAVKFTDAGTVTLSLRREGDEVRFGVRDTGIGIGANDLRRLFHPFSQLDTGLTRRHGGTGLGLYISQRLARLLDGRIEVQSTPGVGSLFTIVLPVAVRGVKDAEPDA